MSEPLSYLDARALAKGQAREGELLARFWREDGGWHCQYARVVDVAGYRTYVAGRIETVGPATHA